MYIWMYIYVYISLQRRRRVVRHAVGQKRKGQPHIRLNTPVSSQEDDDLFTPTKHLTPPPHHSSRPAAAHTDTETPLQ